MPKQNPEEADEIAPGTVIDGRYRVVRGIGQGGNGMVYEVEHTRTGRKLALKALLDETGFARLEQEARAASLMKNEHTARIIDMEAGGSAGAYLVMELLEGQNLRALLDDAGQLPLELTVNVAMQVCECLQESHELGVIHRDLKPENLFLCASPWPGQYDVKVLDFGVMKISADGGAIPKRSLTRTGSTVGTPYYMSLEQLRNSSGVDARADVYSLGVVLYECLSGRKPYQADTIGDLVYALCSGPPTQLSRLRPDLPPDMTELVMRTLNANRDERPATMLDLALALLPHANPAFALWVKVDGKQPALSLASSAAHGIRGAPQSIGLPAIDPSLVAVAVVVPRRGLPDLSGERRDTPTEMYVKGAHGVELPVEGEGEGDRDTPTRALVLEGGYPRAISTLKSPQKIDDMKFVPPAPFAQVGGGPLSPSAPTAKLTIPLGDLYRQPTGAGGPIVAPTTPPPSAPPSSLPMPPASSAPAPTTGWQAALDRALIGLGRASERQMKRFREAPQNTQIIVLIVIGTAVILVTGVVLFVALH